MKKLYNNIILYLDWFFLWLFLGRKYGWPVLPPKQMTEEQQVLLKGNYPE